MADLLSLFTYSFYSLFLFSSTNYTIGGVCFNTACHELGKIGLSLYVVATPIGNLEDVTLRALRVLREADLIAAEDTRLTRKLLAKYEIRTPLISFHGHNHVRQTPRVLAALEEGDVALVSDAGVPTVSDPGAELVRRALELGVRVVPIPGPSAVTTALSASGLRAERFTFAGFLPRRRGERLRRLKALADVEDTLVIFEAPHRLRGTLEDVLGAWGDRRVTVCRELTKRYEEIFVGGVSEALERFQEPRGEFTLVVEGADRVEPSAWELERVREALRELKGEGVRAKEAVSRVAEVSGVRRRLVYGEWLSLD